MMRFRLISTVAAGAIAATIASPTIAGEVRGLVADATANESLQAAEVTIEELGRRTTTAPDGT